MPLAIIIIRPNGNLPLKHLERDYIIIIIDVLINLTKNGSVVRCAPFQWVMWKIRDMYFSRSSRSRDTAIWHCSFLNFENIQSILREKRLRNLSIFDKNWFCLLPEKIKRTSHHHFQLATLYNRGNHMATSLNYTFRPHVSCSTNFQLKCHWSQTSQGRERWGVEGAENSEKN